MLCAACKDPLPPSAVLPTPKQKEELLELVRLPFIATASHSSQYESKIASSIEALAQYDSGIGRLRKSLADMLADREELREYLDGCRSLFSPLRRLPAEVLCQIFTPFSTSFDSGDQRYSRRPPLSEPELHPISLVCARWHDIILDTPALWSDISVTLRPGYECSTSLPQFLRRLQTTLKRGARHSLKLSIVFWEHLGSQAAGAVLSLLGQHSARWEHVSLTIPLSLLDILRGVKWRLPVLEQISITLVSHPFEASAETNDILVFENAPKLQRVLCSSITSPSFCPRVPWSQLRLFDYRTADNFGIVDVGAAICAMRKLSHPEARFNFRTPNFSRYLNLSQTLPPTTSTISSFLIDVTLQEQPQLAFDKVFRCLTLPRLRELHIQSRMIWPTEAFQSLATRSSFQDNLRILVLPGVVCSEDELFQTLASLTSVEHLVIADQRYTYGSLDRNLPDSVLITNSLLLRLTLPTDMSQSRLVPRLKYLGCISLCTFTGQIYLDCIASRIIPGQRPFQAVLSRIRGVSFEFKPDVLRDLDGMVDRRELQFRLEDEKIKMDQRLLGAYN